MSLPWSTWTRRPYNLMLKEIIKQLEGHLMLIKTEVKRRTEAINNYLLDLKDKIWSHKYREAKHILKTSFKTLSSSYMTSYDPNSYLLDSLKSKRQKLIKEKAEVQSRMKAKLQDINAIKTRRGFTRSSHSQEESEQFICKLRISGTAVYVSRLPIRLEDATRIDYETNICIETNFHELRASSEQADHIVVPFNRVVSCQAETCYVLICWRADKTSTNFHMLIKFEDEEERKMWSRCITFCKLICESEFKDQLLFKQPKSYNINVVKNQQQAKPSQQAIAKQLFERPPSSSKGYMNLNISSNKSNAFDRLRRRSEYYPTNQNQTTTGLINRSKSRKVSEDLTMKESQFNKSLFHYDRRMNNERSQKSFEDEPEPSYNSKKQEDSYKKPEIALNGTKIDKIVEERERLFSDAKLSSQNTQSNRQIFFNESSIHWIEQQNEQANSKSSHGVSKTMFAKKNILQVFNKETHQEQSEHISEVPAEGEESPLLPYNLREKLKRNKNMENSKFEVRVKEVPMLDKQANLQALSRKSQKSNSNNAQPKPGDSRNQANVNDDPLKENSMSKEASDESDLHNQIESINEQSEDDDSQEKDKQNSNIEVEDKSQDLVSEHSNSETESRKYGLDDLKFGILLLKCSPNGWNPHIKKLHLSNNDSQLCWKNEKGDDLKKINLSDIQKIDYNSTITGGILKHIKKNIEKRRCLVIKYKVKNDNKMLQFYLPDNKKVEELQNFYSRLNSYFMFKNKQQ